MSFFPVRNNMSVRILPFSFFFRFSWFFSTVVFTFLSISTSAKEEIKKKSKHPQDNRLSRREFRQFLIMVVDNMPGADSFEYFIEFLNNSVEVSTAHTGVSCVSFTLNFYSLLIKNFLIPLWSKTRFFWRKFIVIFHLVLNENLLNANQYLYNSSTVL